MDNVQDIGLRQVIGTQEMSEVLGILQDKNSTMNVSWNKRYRANLDKIKSGNIFEVAEVVRNLTIRDKDKGLSTGERKMLENAKRILISELVLVKDIAEDQVEDLLHKVLA
jgi:CarD family transcriptional regulator